MIARTFSMLSLLFLSAACHEKNQNDSKAVKEELRSRKPIHLTQVQIEERAYQLGDTLLAKSERDFLQSLKSSKDTSCIPVFQKIADSVNARYGATLARIPFNPARLKNISSEKEKEVLDACFYNRENHLRIDPNLQKDGDKEFIYTRPLVLADSKCVTCHSQPKNALMKGSKGDTLAIWSLRLLKKQVVMSFVD